MHPEFAIDDPGGDGWFGPSRQVYWGLAAGSALGALVFAIAFSRNLGESQTASSEAAEFQRSAVPPARGTLANSANLP